jgi:hypothetical protein
MSANSCACPSPAQTRTPCRLSEIHFGLPLPALTRAEMNVGELLRLPIACADPDALPVERNSFRSPIACSRPDAEMNVGELLRLPIACARPGAPCRLSEIHFGRPSPVQTRAEMNVGELLRLPIACADPGALPVERNSFRSPIACPDPCRNECRRTLAPAHRLRRPGRPAG